MSLSDIIVLGPNEVSYCNIDAIDSILGVNGLPKGPCKFRPIVDQDVELVLIFYISLLSDNEGSWPNLYQATS
jgi:hypothetical protein